MLGMQAESDRETVALSRERVVARKPSRPLHAASRSFAMAAEAPETSATALATLSNAPPFCEQNAFTLSSSTTNWLKSIGQLLKSPDMSKATTFPSLILAEAFAHFKSADKRSSEVSANMATKSASVFPFMAAASVALSRPRKAFTIASGLEPFIEAKIAETHCFASSGTEPQRLWELVETISTTALRSASEDDMAPLTNAETEAPSLAFIFFILGSANSLSCPTILT